MNLLPKTGALNSGAADERGPGQPFCCGAAGHRVVINVIERPGRMGIERFIDGAAENYLWPEGRSLIRGMQSELMIAVGGGFSPQYAGSALHPRSRYDSGQ